MFLFQFSTNIVNYMHNVLILRCFDEKQGMGKKTDAC